jgi:hypothetical protein
MQWRKWLSRAHFAFACAVWGCAINLLVAWGCALWSPVTRSTAPPNSPAPGIDPPMIAGPSGAPRAWWLIARGWGIEHAVAEGARWGDDEFLYYRGQSPPIQSSGWPAYSMRSQVTPIHGENGDALSMWDLPVKEIWRRGPRTEFLPDWMHVNRLRRVPLVPLWSGVVADTTFYAILVGACCWMWQSYRPRRVERRRGFDVMPRGPSG